MKTVQRLGPALVATLLAYAVTASAHWPGQAQHQMAELGEFRFEDGGLVKNFRMSYVTHGKLNAAKNNAILVLHGFAANHHTLDHLIGPGRALDTSKYFIICADAMDLFAEGKADAFVGYAQEPAELRARKIGRVIVETAHDRPWSQYFCCMLVANRDFVQRNPIATKRALRAILKAADVCAAEPERAARFLFEKQYEPRYPIGLDVMKRAVYSRWREASPEDTLRFYALRLREVGMIKSTPQKLIAQGTDWRFLNELKKELKA